MHIATHSAIRTIDHLGELLKHLSGSNGPFNTIELHRTKCSKLILNVIAPAYLKELIDDVGSKPYSIILDESTDIGTHKYMAFCIRYHSVSLCDIVTDFLGFTQVNIIFQSTNVDISKAYSDLKRLLISIVNRILKSNHITSIILRNADGKMLNVIDVKLFKNALRFLDSNLPLNCVDFGYQFEEQSRLSIETRNLTKVQLESVQERSSNFLFRLCHEMCNRLPDNLQLIEKIKYLSPAECFNQFARPLFSQLPIELAGKSTNINKYFIFYDFMSFYIIAGYID